MVILCTQNLKKIYSKIYQLLSEWFFIQFLNDFEEQRDDLFLLLLVGLRPQKLMIIFFQNLSTLYLNDFFIWFLNDYERSDSCYIGRPKASKSHDNLFPESIDSISEWFFNLILNDFERSDPCYIGRPKASKTHDNLFPESIDSISDFWMTFFLRLVSMAMGRQTSRTKIIKTILSSQFVHLHTADTILRITPLGQSLTAFHRDNALDSYN